MKTIALDKNEAEIALMALRRFMQEADTQMTGNNTYSQVWAAAWHACRHCRDKCSELVDRIERWQQKDAADDQG